MQSSSRIEELRQKFHENPRRYFAPLANEYRKAGDPEQAIAICRAHLAQQPAHMSGHVVYGQALYDARRTDEARDVFQLALALDPENIIVLRHLGDIARLRGDVEEARSWYSRALDGDPQDAEVAAYLAELTEPLVSHGADIEATALTATENETAAQIEPETETETPIEPETDTAASGPPGGEPFRVAPLEARSEPDESPYLEPEEEMRADAGEPASDVVSPPAERQTRPTPTSETFPIVTRTLAELYLQQGHIEAALDIYRQLATHEPDDADIRARIAALTVNAGVGASPVHAPVEMTEASADDDDSGLMEEAAGAGEMRDGDGASAESDSSTEEASDKLWDTADFWGGGFFADTEEADEIFGLSDDALSAANQGDKDAPPPEPELEEAELDAVPGANERAPGAQPADPATEAQSEEMAAEGDPSELAGETEPESETESPARELTVREFFATLGSMHAPIGPAPHALADDAFANLFANAPISAEDSRAAAALSSAVAHGAPFSTPVSASVRPRPEASSPRGADQPGQESEEDVRRFREWLDGLADS